MVIYSLEILDLVNAILKNKTMQIAIVEVLTTWLLKLLKTNNIIFVQISIVLEQYYINLQQDYHHIIRIVNKKI